MPLAIGFTMVFNVFYFLLAETNNHHFSHEVFSQGLFLILYETNL
jgi:hypothetical protein